MSRKLYFPDVLQNTNYNCGVVCVQAALAYYGIEFTEPKLDRVLKTSKKWGTGIKNIVNFFEKKGFRVEHGGMSEKIVKRYIDKKIPVIILIQAWGPDDVDYRHTNQYGHYVIASGYNSKGFYIEDPAIFGRGFISYNNLKKRWHADDEGEVNNYGIAVFGKKPYDYSKYYTIP